MGFFGFVDRMRGKDKTHDRSVAKNALENGKKSLSEVSKDLESLKKIAMNLVIEDGERSNTLDQKKVEDFKGSVKGIHQKIEDVADDIGDGLQKQLSKADTSRSGKAANSILDILNRMSGAVKDISDEWKPVDGNDSAELLVESFEKIMDSFKRINKEVKSLRTSDTLGEKVIKKEVEGLVTECHDVASDLSGVFGGVSKMLAQTDRTESVTKKIDANTKVTVKLGDKVEINKAKLQISPNQTKAILDDMLDKEKTHKERVEIIAKNMPKVESGIIRTCNRIMSNKNTQKLSLVEKSNLQNFTNTCKEIAAQITNISKVTNAKTKEDADAADAVEVANTLSARYKKNDKLQIVYDKQLSKLGSAKSDSDMKRLIESINICVDEVIPTLSKGEVPNTEKTPDAGEEGAKDLEGKDKHDKDDKPTGDKSGDKHDKDDKPEEKSKGEGDAAPEDAREEVGLLIAGVLGNKAVNGLEPTKALDRLFEMALGGDKNAIQAFDTIARAKGVDKKLMQKCSRLKMKLTSGRLGGAISKIVKERNSLTSVHFDLEQLRSNLTSIPHWVDLEMDEKGILYALAGLDRAGARLATEQLKGARDAALKSLDKICDGTPAPSRYLVEFLDNLLDYLPGLKSYRDRIRASQLSTFSHDLTPAVADLLAKNLHNQKNLKEVLEYMCGIDKDEEFAALNAVVTGDAEVGRALGLAYGFLSDADVKPLSKELKLNGLGLMDNYTKAVSNNKDAARQDCFLRAISGDADCKKILEKASGIAATNQLDLQQAWGVVNDFGPVPAGAAPREVIFVAAFAQLNLFESKQHTNLQSLGECLLGFKPGLGLARCRAVIAGLAGVGTNFPNKGKLFAVSTKAAWLNGGRAYMGLNDELKTQLVQFVCAPTLDAGADPVRGIVAAVNTAEAEELAILTDLSAADGGRYRDLCHVPTGDSRMGMTWENIKAALTAIPGFNTLPTKAKTALFALMHFGSDTSAEAPTAYADDVIAGLQKDFVLSCLEGGHARECCNFANAMWDAMSTGKSLSTLTNVVGKAQVKSDLKKVIRAMDTGTDDRAAKNYGILEGLLRTNPDTVKDPNVQKAFMKIGYFKNPVPGGNTLKSLLHAYSDAAATDLVNLAQHGNEDAVNAIALVYNNRQLTSLIEHKFNGIIDKLEDYKTVTKTLARLISANRIRVKLEDIPNELQEIIVAAYTGNDAEKATAKNNLKNLSKGTPVGGLDPVTHNVKNIANRILDMLDTSRLPADARDRILEGRARKSR